MADLSVPSPEEAQATGSAFGHFLQGIPDWNISQYLPRPAPPAYRRNPPSASRSYAGPSSQADPTPALAPREYVSGGGADAPPPSYYEKGPVLSAPASTDFSSLEEPGALGAAIRQAAATQKPAQVPTAPGPAGPTGPLTQAQPSPASPGLPAHEVDPFSLGLVHFAGDLAGDVKGEGALLAAQRAEAFKDKRNSIQSAIDILNAAHAGQNVNLPLLAAAGALGMPTKSGTFSESLSNAFNAAVPAVEKQRAADMGYAKEQGTLGIEGAGTGVDEYTAAQKDWMDRVKVAEEAQKSADQYSMKANNAELRVAGMLQANELTNTTKLNIEQQRALARIDEIRERLKGAAQLRAMTLDQKMGEFGPKFDMAWYATHPAGVEPTKEEREAGAAALHQQAVDRMFDSANQAAAQVGASAPQSGQPSRPVSPINIDAEIPRGVKEGQTYLETHKDNPQALSTFLNFYATKVPPNQREEFVAKLKAALSTPTQ